MSNVTGSDKTTGGWTCYHCGMFVPYGASHSHGTIEQPEYRISQLSVDNETHRLLRRIIELLEILVKP